MKCKLLLTALCALAGLATYAHDFTATVNGQKLFFDITSNTKKTIAVTFNGSIADKKVPTLTGIVEIPAKVKHNNIVYEVKSISPKAFANAVKITGVVIPSGVESIGDFAFENCKSLKSVVFPGNAVSLGQGIFFNCSSIASVTIGSDWKTVDLTLFRWSRQLKSISIPAKIEKIQGLKKLKYLESINVDPNNSRFASYEGMLYSKDGKTFYACPRSYAGTVVIKDGVVKIQDGALIDCLDITSIDFPAGLKNVSFRETSRMKGLETIIMRGTSPIITGYINNTGKFLFMLANPKTQIVVLSSAKNAYERLLATEEGEYSASAKSVPYMVTQSELPTKKSLKGVKNFDKYKR